MKEGIHRHVITGEKGEGRGGLMTRLIRKSKGGGESGCNFGESGICVQLGRRKSDPRGNPIKWEGEGEEDGPRGGTLVYRVVLLSVQGRGGGKNTKGGSSERARREQKGVIEFLGY